MKGFTAYHNQNFNAQRAIITVYADDVDAAREMIAFELNKPGRGAYLKRWLRDGRIVRERKEVMRLAETE